MHHNRSFSAGNCRRFEGKRRWWADQSSCSEFVLYVAAVADTPNAFVINQSFSIFLQILVRYINTVYSTIMPPYRSHFESFIFMRNNSIQRRRFATEQVNRWRWSEMFRNVTVLLYLYKGILRLQHFYFWIFVINVKVFHLKLSSR